MTATTRPETAVPDDFPFDQDAPDPPAPNPPAPNSLVPEPEPEPHRAQRQPLVDLARLRPYSGRHRAPVGTPREREPRSVPGAPVPRDYGFWDHRRFVHVGGGEFIAVEVQPSLQSWLPKVPVWLAIAAVLGAVAAVAGDSAPIAWVTLAGFVALFWWVGVRLARWRLAWYVVTNKRVMRVEGVWRRQAFTVPLDRITDVTYEQNWIEGKLRIGTVRVLSANEDSLVRELRSVPRPDEFFRALWELVNRSKMLLHQSPPTGGAGPGWGTPSAAPMPASQPWDVTTPQAPVTHRTLQF